MTYDKSGVAGAYLLVTPRSATYLGGNAVAQKSSSTTGTGMVMELDVSNVTGSYDICVATMINGYQTTGTSTITLKKLEAL